MQNRTNRPMATLVAILGLCIALAVPAWAGEDDAAASEHRRKKILQGLAQGIEALHALGRKEDVARLKRVYAAVKREGRDHAPREASNERKTAKGWLALMGIAKRTLVQAGRREHAEVIEHGMHALEIILRGKRDEASAKVLATAPSRAEQADCVLLAAEILADKGNERQARKLADLGRGWKRQGRHENRREAARREEPRGERERPGWQREGNAGLAGRAEIMQMARPALREGERKDALETLDRGLHTARVILADREDEEAREIIERTPPLAELSEVLDMAADLWVKFGDRKKAHMVAALARFYAERAQAQRRAEEEDGDEEDGDEEDGDEEDEHDEARERDGDEHDGDEHDGDEHDGDEHDGDEHDGDEHAREREGRGERARALERIHREIREMQAALERLQRRLRELAR